MQKMTKYPVILVLSEGRENPERIIERIRKQPGSDDVDLLCNKPPSDISGFKFHIETKYYQTDLYLVPYNEDVSLLPAEIQEATEAVLIYFDAGRSTFADKIPKYVTFLKENEIELGILLCDHLFDNSNEGVTYREAKQASRYLDVIELERTRGKDEEDDPYDPLGYEELHQALRSFVWSNVKLEDIKAASSNSQSQPEDTDKKNNSVEDELDIFEKLLTEMMNFKSITSSMSRNARLAFAEQLASQFEEIIGDGTQSSNEG